MMLVLTDPNGDDTHLPIRPELMKALREHLRAAAEKVGSERLGELAAYALLSVGLDIVAPDHRPPTPAQTRFALDVASRLGIPLPPGALVDRSVTGAFLTQYGYLLSGRTSGRRALDDGPV